MQRVPLAEHIAHQGGEFVLAVFELAEVELVGVGEMRQTPAIYARVENACGLLKDCYQQAVLALAQVFDPQRFMGVEGKARKKYLVHFSKGTRSCLGQTLANAEIYLCLAALFREEGMGFEVYQTGKEDIEVKHDYFTPMPRKGSRGLRVLIT